MSELELKWNPRPLDSRPVTQTAQIDHALAFVQKACSSLAFYYIKIVGHLGNYPHPVKYYQTTSQS